MYKAGLGPRAPLMELLVPSALLVLSVLAALLLALLDIRKPARFPPGPRWAPLLGSLVPVYSLVRKLGLTHLAWARLAAQYGPLVGLRLGRDRIVLVSGFTLAREALSREDLEGRPDGFLFRLRAFGKRLGVVFTDGGFGQTQRRFVLRHLREQGLGRSAMQDRISEETRHFIHCLHTLSKDGPVDVRRVASVCVLNNLWGMLAGQRFHMEDARLSRLLALILPPLLRSASSESGVVVQDGPVDVRRVASVCVLNNLWGMLAGQRFHIEDARLSRLLALIRRSFSLQDMTGGLLNQLPFLRFLAPRRSNYTQNLDILAAIDAFLSETIEEHKKTLNADNIRDFVDAFLVEIEKTKNTEDSSFNEEQLRVVLLDLFMAGSDTTSNTLAFAVLYLLHHPRVQDLLAAEVETVVGSCGPPTLQHRPSMPYTEAVIMEVLRFTNIATVTIPHRAKCSVQLGGYVLPKDVTVLVSLYSVHMDEDHWGDPHTFRPERFLDAEGNLVQDDWLMPFGLGRRRCLGESLARPMLFLFLTSLLFHFRVAPPPAPEPLPPLAPVDGAVLAPRPFTCHLLPRRPPPTM